MSDAVRKVVEAARRIVGECVWEFDQRGSWGAPSNDAVNGLLEALKAYDAATPEPEAGRKDVNNTTMELRAETTHKIGPITPVMGPIRVECEKACFFHCPPDEELQPPADVRERVRRIADDLTRARKYTSGGDSTVTLRCCITCDIVRTMREEDIAALRAVQGGE